VAGVLFGVGRGGSPGDGGKLMGPGEKKKGFWRITAPKEKKKKKRSMPTKARILLDCVETRFHKEGVKTGGISHKKGRRKPATS